MTPPIVLSAEFLGVVRSLINPVKRDRYPLSVASKNLFYDIMAKVRRGDHTYPHRLEDETKDLCDCTMVFPDNTEKAWLAFEEFQSVFGRFR